MVLKLADVSEFQGDVDWKTYGLACPAAIARVHNGWRMDYKWPRNVLGMRTFTQWRGYYQYLPATVDPATAAHAFQATTGPLLPGEVAILDLEEGTGDQRGRRLAWLNALQDPVEWTYSGLAFARAHLPGVGVEWIAAYGQGEPTDAHKIWQFTNAQRFAGIAGPCDGSVFNGTLAQLEALTNSPEVDMPLTPDDVKAVVTGLLSANLGRSGTNVAQALQHASVLSNLTPEEIIAAVKAAAVTPGAGPTSLTPADILAIAKAVNDDAAARLKL